MISTKNKPWVPNPLRPAELLRRSDTEGSDPPDEPSEAAEAARPSPDESLTGRGLIADPDAALQEFREVGGTDRELIEWYASGGSPVHLLRMGAQPQMLKAGLKSMVPAMSRQLCREAGVHGVGPVLLAEQVTEARVDECYLRMLAGLALEEDDIARAERLGRMADRCSTRMAKTLEQLHRMRRPRVNVRIGKASNVNLGEQTVVNKSADIGVPSNPDGRTETENSG